MDQITIGRFLAQLRHEKEWTQEQLGERLGVTNKTVSRWENGNYMPDIGMLQLLSELYEVTIEELIAGKRLDDAALRAQANAAMVVLAQKEVFTVKEKTAYWKRKWKREHKALIVLLVVLAAGGYFALLLLLDSLGAWRAVASAGWALLYMGVYGMVRNSMMCYVESRVYGSADRNSR